jgi:hypothetical protein
VRALDLAFVGADRLVVLDGAEIALVTIGAGEVAVLSRRPLPGPLSVVRAPGGVLQASESDAAVWAMTSRSPQAVLFAIEGAQLSERERAEALPFPGAARGLRFRAGTNLVEADVEGLGAGPFLDLAAAGAGPLVAVDPEGRLLNARGSEAPLRAGPTLAALWPGHVAASLPSPPDREDAVVVFDVMASGAPVTTCPTGAPVRAVAARVREDVARLAVAVDGADGRPWLHLLDVARPAR